MSILVYDEEDELYKLYSKGADDVVISRLRKQSINKQHLRETKAFLK